MGDAASQRARAQHFGSMPGAGRVDGEAVGEGSAGVDPDLPTRASIAAHDRSVVVERQQRGSCYAEIMLALALLLLGSLVAATTPLTEEQRIAIVTARDGYDQR
ncbi:MAG: hypothetical protein ACREJT_17525, partial [Myxococcota bacterium]